MATDSPATDSFELMLFISKSVGRDVDKLERIEGGRNSQVYRAYCEGSDRYAVKVYHHDTNGHKDRLGSEFSALDFLWENGVRCVPRPIVADQERRCVVYEYIDGEHIPSPEVSDSDLDQSIEFLALLKDLTDAKGSRDLPAASEACFSGQAIVSNIKQRLRSLNAVGDAGPHHNDFHVFLREEFAPSLNVISEWSESQIRQSGMSFSDAIPLEERTLSPSDFGFHNALKLNDGRIVFLDFEHFGWDDPAKLISDYLIHPAMELPEALKQRFVAGMLTRFGSEGQLHKRVQTVYPLFGLKWCLILLNEFIPKDLLRRGFASIAEVDQDQLQGTQLAKASQMLDKTMSEYEHFPYHV